MADFLMPDFFLRVVAFNKWDLHYCRDNFLKNVSVASVASWIKAPSYNTIKDPQWYVVQESDTTMLLIAPLLGQ